MKNPDTEGSATVASTDSFRAKPSKRWLYIGNYKDELELVAEEEMCDVLCVTEHWKDSEQLKDYRLCNYYLASYFCRSKVEHGDSAVFIKNGIEYIRCDDIVRLSVTNVLECSVAEFSVNKNRLIILSVYSLNNDIKYFFVILETILLRGHP
ncbi:hypothetical protein WA026_017659 [Henosepilachna vigintioctopunctata]|uniref:Uncharacterized protein n=1 Tax=Henosepilachna vigintioctopunctata TaxID=420089 RepID=A0AAW1U3W7_9CUCU